MESTINEMLVEEAFEPCAFVFHFGIKLVIFVGIKILYFQLTEGVALRKVL